MSLSARWGVAALAVVDALLGVLLLVWPGAVQEWTHPLALGVVFYWVQYAGATWLVRGLVGIYAAARGRRTLAGALAASWVLAAPADALLAWRTAATGPLAVWVHGGHGVVAVAAGLLAWRLLARAAPDRV